MPRTSRDPEVPSWRALTFRPRAELCQLSMSDIAGSTIGHAARMNAAKSGQHPKTIWNRIGNGDIAVYRIGRSVRIGESEVKRILEEGF